MKHTGKSIDQLQSEIEKALRVLPELAHQLPVELKPLARLAPPAGVCARVSLRHARSDRQVKRSAPADNWSPESGVVSIAYDTSSAGEAGSVETRASNRTHSEVSPSPAVSEDPVRDLVLALARAERDPQLGFVSLKWFRDTFLPRQGYNWATTQEKRQRLLEQAIHSNLIVTSKVPNPKNPQYPVTAIRVNRSLPEARKILDQEAGLGSAFAPITIPGERLSETVLRERR